MNISAYRRRAFFFVAILLVLSVLLEQLWISRLWPEVGALGGLRPMIVFLDIPLHLPTIDLIPVSILFIVLYSVVMSPELGREGVPKGPELRKRLWGIFLGFAAVLVSLGVGGGLFYLVQDSLPKVVRNGIDSFGIQADVVLPYPLEGVFHLRGSMILLVCGYFGMRVLIRKAAGAAVATPERPAVEKPVVMTAERAEVAATGGPRAATGGPGAVTGRQGAATVRPRKAVVVKPAGQRLQPCIVEGKLVARRVKVPVRGNPVRRVAMEEVGQELAGFSRKGQLV